MKTTITIYLDSGTKVALSLDEAIELRDKLNKLAPVRETELDRWLKSPWDPPNTPPSWPPGTIICGYDNKGV